MIVIDELVKPKVLLCLLLTHFLMVLAGENYLFEKSLVEKRSKRTVGEEAEKILKINKQITIFLSGEESEVYEYIDTETRDHNLSVIITPCSTSVLWSFAYRSIDESNRRDAMNFFGNYESSQMRTVTVERARQGSYYIIFQPLDKNVRVSIYVTMDVGGPYELTVHQRSNLNLIPQRKQKLKVTWEPTSVNPQNTSFCLVVSTLKEYPSLCGAEEEGPTIRGIEIPVIISPSNLKLEKRKRGKFAKFQRGMKRNNGTAVYCLGRKKQLTLTRIRKGIKYYFSLFAINNKTNLTIPYGTSFITYNFTVKPILLRDGVQELIDLRKLEGKASFRFKANKANDELHFYVLVCGGAVDVEFKTKGIARRNEKKTKESTSLLPKQTRVFGYRKFQILHPAKGEQFYLKVNAPGVDELTRIKYVEVFATQSPTKRYPLPLLPEDTNLYEFKSKKSCRSITVGWIPSYDASINNYCVQVWKNRKFNYADLFRDNFQCNLDEKPEKGFFFSLARQDFISKECNDSISKEKSITIYEVRHLKPGTSYTIRVTVKKKKGRTLSYKPLKTLTKHSCKF